jgi:hypothetical protein
MSVEWVSHLHLVTFILMGIYGFIFSKNAFDPFYLFITYGTVAHWSFLNGECLVTYLYKKHKNPNYIPGKDLETNEFETTYRISPDDMRIVIFLQSVLWITSMHIVLKRNQFPPSMSISFVILFFSYYLLRLVSEDHYKNKVFLILQEIIKYAFLLYGIILLYGLYKRVIR